MKLLAIFVLSLVISGTLTLRCQTDDGITDEEVIKTLKICVRKQNNENNDYEEYSDYSWESLNNKKNSFNKDNRPTHQHKRNVYKNIYNKYIVEKRSSYQGSRKDFRNDTKDNNKTSDTRRNSGERCLIQCFFEENKMVDTDGFPDKHRVLHVLTKDLRDRELRDFYINSIQECFHIASMKKRSEKCQFSQDIIVCLTERAKTNCDDWDVQY